MTEKEYVIKVEHGNVRLYDSNGAFKRHFCGNAARAELKGEEIIVTFNNGARKLFNINGKVIESL